MAKVKRNEAAKDAGKQKKYIPGWVILCTILLLAGIGAAFAFSIPGLGKGEKARAVNGAITIPLSKVSDGKAHFYRFDDGGKSVGFFVVKGSDGALHTAFDACDVCFHEHKGYEQQGEFMVCRNCNKKFAVNMIGKVGGGGCNPSYLNHSENGNNVVIKVADLKPGAQLF
ncbi:MAG TPA: DUF2318 domain-containing protein [Geobacteraceae bacterium]